MHRVRVCVSSAWVVVQVWDSTGACLKFLKAAGYFIAATHLAPNSVPISELDWTRPTCIVMGNESYGESKRMARIPKQEELCIAAEAMHVPCLCCHWYHGHADTHGHEGWNW